MALHPLFIRGWKQLSAYEAIECLLSEQEQKECFYNAVKADEIEMDFNDWKNQNFRKALAEMESIYGQINFSLLQNAKDSKKKKKN